MPNLGPAPGATLHCPPFCPYAEPASTSTVEPDTQWSPEQAWGLGGWSGGEGQQGQQHRRGSYLRNAVGSDSKGGPPAVTPGGEQHSVHSTSSDPHSLHSTGTASPSFNWVDLSVTTDGDGASSRGDQGGLDGAKNCSGGPEQGNGAGSWGPEPQGQGTGVEDSYLDPMVAVKNALGGWGWDWVGLGGWRSEHWRARGQSGCSMGMNRTMQAGVH